MSKLQHITFIMDGNGRWAQSQGKTRTEGHHEGAQRFEELVFAGGEMGIPVMSFYAFSKENWTRPQDEVNVIMGLWGLYMDGVDDRLIANNTRIHVIGDRSDLPATLVQQIESTERNTEHCTGTQVLIMLSYSARWEMIEAVKQIAHQVKNGLIDADQIDDQVFADHLATAGFPDPDLLVRTSGEQRISNYMLWQLSYTEFMFVDTPWPEFTPEQMIKCINTFEQRDRRFGGIDEDVAYRQPTDA